MRRVVSRSILLVMCVCLGITAFVPATALAEVPYYTFSRDSYDRLVYSQPAYIPMGVMGHDIYIEDPDTGEVEYSELNRPQDVFIDRNDEIYIADTDNDRIVHLSEEGEFIRVIDLPDDPLSGPRGVFVDEQFNIFIADTGNQRVVKLDSNGNFEREYLRPDSDYIPAGFRYEPFKVIVDNRGFLFVATVGGYQGLLQMDPEGEFQGFYGTNATEVTLMDIVRRLLYTEEQLRRQVRLLPGAITSVDIDDDSRFIYTTTIGISEEQVKKLNINSENRFEDLAFGEYLFRQQLAGTGGERNPQLFDLTVDTNGNVTTIDRNFNVVSQYDDQGELLFFWTGPIRTGTPQLGIVHSPVAIASNSRNELFILDDNQNMLQGFRPTHFGQLVHEAGALTADGRYGESKDLWEEIVRLNAHFSPAYNGLGLAAYHEAEYELAMDYYELAGNNEGYSDAFWQIRLLWLQSNFALIANALVVLTVLAIVGGQLRKRYSFDLSKYTSRMRKYTLIDQILHGFYVLRHPIEGFGDLRYDNKGSYLSAFIVLFLAFFALALNIYFTSFSFRGMPLDEFNIGLLAVQFFAIWATWVLCNYLISSIYRGEGRLKDVFMGSAYALFPLVVLAVPIAIVSNVMALSEEAVYTFMEWFMIIWCGALFFWKIQTLQNYSVGETIVNIILTLFAMLMFWVLIFITFGLTSEFLGFLYSLYQEVSIR